MSLDASAAELSAIWKRQVTKLGSAAAASRDLHQSLLGQGVQPLYGPAKPDVRCATSPCLALSLLLSMSIGRLLR